MKLVKRLLALSAATSAFFPSAAQAQAQAQDGPVAIGGGLFVGVAFESMTVEWGAETFVTFNVQEGDSCTRIRTVGSLGPLFQVSVVGLREKRITAALQGGGELSPDGERHNAILGALGISYRFSDQPGFGVHSALSYEWMAVNASLRRQWLLDQTSMVAGLRYALATPPVDTCILGRPLRTSQGLARIDERARMIAEPCGDGPKPRSEALERAGRAWERDAQYECASIPAFLQLAADLLTHDAPDRLIERALSAAEDEMRHAALCADMASRYLQTRIWPTLPRGEGAAHPRRPSLSQLAVESWMDGCLSEGAAAARALRAAELARDPSAKWAQTRIAADEARHADLGADVVSWALSRRQPDVRDALLHACDAETAAADPDTPSLESYGRLGAPEIEAITARHVNRSCDILARLLSRA